MQDTWYICLRFWPQESELTCTIGTPTPQAAPDATRQVVSEREYTKQVKSQRSPENALPPQTFTLNLQGILTFAGPGTFFMRSYWVKRQPSGKCEEKLTNCRSSEENTLSRLPWAGSITQRRSKDSAVHKRKLDFYKALWPFTRTSGYRPF